MDSLCALYIFTALLLSSFPYGKGADVRGKGNHNETGNMIELLQRISEEMPTLSGLRNSIGVALENLHTLDFRLTQVEMQGKDQQTAARAEWQSQNRVLETLNWEISKISTLTEVLRQDLHTLNQAVLEVKFHLNHEEPANKSLALGVERVSSNKLRLMSATLISLKGSLATMESAMTGIVQNVTYITNISRALDGRLRQTVTRSDLHNKLLDLKDHMQPHHCPSPLPSAGTNERVPRSCSEVAAEMPSGIYLLQPKGLLKPWFAYCDMKTQDGGWTVMHHRYEGQQEFYRDWHDYKHGFGNLGGEFWLGLEKIHLLTSQEVCELRIELEDFDGVKVVASYEAFAVGSEVEGYSLKLLGKYDGDAGDSFLYHAGMKFTTFDVDNDLWPDDNCAEMHSGAWWYNGCDTCNLNGRYMNGQLPVELEYKGMYWYDYRGPAYSLAKARMLIRPARFSRKLLH